MCVYHVLCQARKGTIYQRFKIKADTETEAIAEARRRLCLPDAFGCEIEGAESVA